MNTKEGDEFIRDLLARAVPAREVLNRLDGEVRTTYWQGKDLPRSIALGTAGIEYALAEASHEQSTGDRDALLQAAKTLAYNVGSFTWPGWDEPGIAIGPNELRVGYECAQINLRLAVELNRPPERVADAHWLIGAHLLAQCDWPSALEAFNRAAALNPSPLMKGYVLLARLGAGDPSVDALWDAAMEALLRSPDKNAAEYRSQLITAQRVLAKR